MPRLKLANLFLPVMKKFEFDDEEDIARFFKLALEQQDM
jgi:hypothetical protein